MNVYVTFFSETEKKVDMSIMSNIGVTEINKATG